MTEAATQDDAVWRDWIAAIRKPGVGAVIALTIVGAVLRFARLAHPPLLFDEAATYTRVTGSFAELLGILRYDGFAPLHYELYWAMSRFVRLTPAMMRIVPAIAGTLMIPAIYFLARQMVSRRVATLAAAITCFSAWMGVYSRDAKMYMELWLCATLFIASLLWWMRVPSRVGWMAFVAAGCTMNGLHALGLCVTGVAIVVLLIHPLLTRRKFLLASLGLLLSVAGIAGHYAFFNRFNEKLATQGWRSSGLDWVGQRNAAMSKPFLLWDTLASWTLAYRSPRPPIEPPNRVIVPVVVVSILLGGLFLLSLGRWRKELRDDDPDDAPPGRAVIWMGAWILLPMAVFGVVAIVSKHDVWNARYLGIVWPALAVLMALGIQRLPMPALRAGAIGLLIGANAIQYGLRISVESGVPVDQIARDLTIKKSDAETVRTVVAVKEDVESLGLGGGGGVFDFPGRYYLDVLQHLHLRPVQLRDEPIGKFTAIPQDVANVPASVEKLIVWTDGRKADEENDPILRQLGPEWMRTSAAEHTVRDFWCWRSMFRCTRSVYVRGEASDAVVPLATPAPSAKKKRTKR